MLHVPGAFGQVLDLGFRAADGDDPLCQAVDGDAAAVGHVVDARELGLGGQVGVGGGDVLDVDEVASLFAVAVDGDRFAFDRLVHEDGDGGGVLAPGVLARAEDVEVAHAGGV